MIPSTTNNSPLCKDTSTEVRASPSEVKKLDDRMFEPFSRKAKAQTAAPMEVIFSTWLPRSDGSYLQHMAAPVCKELGDDELVAEKHDAEQNDADGRICLETQKQGLFHPVQMTGSVIEREDRHNAVRQPHEHLDPQVQHIIDGRKCSYSHFSTVLHHHPVEEECTTVPPSTSMAK